MSEKYYLIPTIIGRAMIAEAIQNGLGINLKNVAVGDAEYTPSANQSSLVAEKALLPISNISRPENNPAWLKISAVIPPDIGGWHIHEVGIFAENGNLFAVGKMDGSYKPVYQDGMVKEVQLDLILEISDEANVVLKIDPHVLTVSWSMLDPYLLSAFAIRLDRNMNLSVERAENGDSLSGKHSQRRFLLPRGSRFVKDKDQNFSILIPN